MPRAPRLTDNEIPMLEQLLAHGEGASTVEQKVELAQMIRDGSRDHSRRLDQALFEQQGRYVAGLTQAQAAQAQLQEMLERLDAPPWYPAVFLRAVTTTDRPLAMVLHGNAPRLVGLAQEVSLESLAAGDEVFLAKDLNVIAAKSPHGMPRCGETASFDRVTGDGRCVLRWRDEEVVVDPASTLQLDALQHGDQVRWDRAAWMAFEKIERALGHQYLLNEVPDIARTRVGGQDAQLDTLLSALTATLVAPEKATRYGLGGRQSILMVGPPGVGKTLMARVAAAELTRLNGTRCRFGVVKPGELESPWVGETQMNIRNCFKALRTAAEGGCAVLFMDEIEAIGRIRGGAVSQHADKFLAALLAELDGFTQRTGVAIIAATNRKDLVDPALLERVSDVEISVRRPDMRGAKAIFDIHLPASLPFHPNGSEAGDTRRETIETAVSRLYSPNADNELCTIRFRDGKTRSVAARELVSGRMVEQICRAACHAAFLRDLRDEEVGVRTADVEEAVANAMERIASTLSPRNAHAYLTDLPQDVDVVSVERIVRKVQRPLRYLNAA